MFSDVGECREENVNLRENIGVRDAMDDEMVEIIDDLHGPMFEECRRESNEQDESDKISGMFPEIEEELYLGCLKFTSFNFLMKLMHIKIMHHLTNVCIVESLDIEDMRWHKDKRCETEGILQHPADAEGWKHFDEQYSCFASDA
ncbi:Transposon, En/Spm-like protein [Cucumis melo var. makuwa]|uniref:Transposon, En/Spm-like protein n=1 Tax=Cucumis melo var. makuwa TaxID=1194695 RepID=A0A5D3DE88_CUCMM|nr:Transposon, En/Spm-like protein [Cucumis melo var. makuwa]